MTNFKILISFNIRLFSFLLEMKIQIFLWLEMMIKHHDGAIVMARIELTEGGDAEAKKLAQAIVDGQGKEIAAMNSLLAGNQNP